MLIRNYGLFWNVEDVFWGRPKVTGSLLGKDTSYLTGPAVDFREQQGVYVLYDENYRMIYVGQAGYGNDRLFKRLRSHHRSELSGRWVRFSWFGLCAVEDNQLRESETLNSVSVRDALNHIEGVLISAAEPPLNRQGARFGDAKAYIQHRDPRFGPTQSEMLAQLWEASGLKPR